MAAPRPVSLTAAATAPHNHEPEPLVVVGGVPAESLPVATTSVAGIAVLPTPEDFIADPTGGETEDAEARAAIAAILDLLIAQGLMASEASE
jgi:hypothetical protein